MKKALRRLRDIFEAAMVGAIAGIVVMVISGAVYEEMKRGGGVILASEQVSFEYAPYVAGIAFFLFWLRVKSMNDE